MTGYKHRFLYEVVLEPDEEDSTAWIVSVPDLPGCYTQGNDLKDATMQAVDALMTYLGVLLKDNEPVPDPTFGHVAPSNGRVAVISFETDEGYILDAVSPSEAAEMLGISRGRVSQMIKAGQLKAHQAGVVTWVDRDSIYQRLAASPKAGRPRKIA